MPHDYAKRKKPPSKKTKPSGGLPAWFWLFTGIISGLFIAFLIYLSNLQLQENEPKSIESGQTQSKTSPSDEIKAQADRLREGKEALKKPTFTFYKRLPELIIETPKPDKVANSNRKKKSYILQAGSFRSFQDADALKAQLIMHGLEVQVDTAEDQAGSEWHRVKVGPYSTQNSLNKAQDVLANNNIPSLLIEVE